MLNTPWQSLVEMNRLGSEMDRVFGRYGNGSGRATAFPPLNLWEDDDNLYVEAELPGFELDDLEIYVTGGNQLSISGERKQPEHEAAVWHRRERAFGKFRRTLELVGRVDSDKVSAHFNNGVLMLTMPKAEEAKPRRIEVKAN
ncbi:Spore protein SP21 [Novipirellula aureliae]|uniref:Spore protein SP21 n=1 Tax=Novipirellula aureliae TaxID=2527966 RepID=A0A5C6E8F8_9BACT|nr:Hsp20/alpha crystallin family protein [Novipirellula aureliae]TWU43499.1 Spore protein SP21 [Novipirellula aureliae]